jgi:hypothetical protein
MFSVQVSGHQDRQQAAKTSIQVRSDQWAGWRKVSRKKFTGLPGSIICMAVATTWVRPGKGTKCWTMPRRTSMSVLSPAVGLSVRWQTESRKACPRLRNVSLKRYIQTPWLIKCSNSSFLHHSLSHPPGETKRFTSPRPPRACSHIQPRRG